MTQGWVVRASILARSTGTRRRCSNGTRIRSRKTGRLVNQIAAHPHPGAEPETMSRKTSMDASVTPSSNWISVREALPEEGTPVQFSFNQRALVLRGIFRYGAFASRWSRYLPTEISSWRKLEPEESLADGEGPHRLLFETDDQDDTIRGLPAAFAPSWSQRPARPTVRG